MADNTKKYPSRKSSELETHNLDVFVDKFESLRDKFIKDFTELINERLNELANHVFQRVDDLENLVNNNVKTIKNNTEEIKKLKNSFDALKNDNTYLKEKLESATVKLQGTENKLEDKTNRQLRKTLIFTGIKEEANEGYDVASLLAKSINKASKGKITESEANGFIERAHRGKARSRSKRGNRPIFAAIDDWRHSELVKKVFLDKKNETGIYCEQMYGPMTTWRRNLALAKRKELKANGSIMKGYVAFPAKLMVQRAGEDIYRLYKDYSNEKVIYDK